ncbi:MAG TPA: GNAT family N-acetyltransferase [Spirochaetia bacterium]|nr:GNAT family N-acetyltransferase [Spirochaetia bacterium]
MDETIEIHIVARNEIDRFRELIEIFAQEFVEEEYENLPDGYLSRILRQRGFHVVVALCNGHVVGGSTAFEITRYNRQTSEMFIYDVAVRRSFQRQGVGRAVLAGIQDHCVGAGIRECLVLADAEDAAAIDFYRAAGGAQQKAVAFTFT